MKKKKKISPKILKENEILNLRRLKNVLFFNFFE
jgi:hypothetical protein